jgi:hypothetical protein
VFVQTIQKYLWFCTLLWYPGLCSGAPNPELAARLTVSVYNDAKVPASAIASAEAVASRVFGQAGLEVNWIHCESSGNHVVGSPACIETAYPTHLHVRIIAHPRQAKRGTFGMSYLSADGVGCQSDIFFARIAEMNSGSVEEMGQLLGHVMAHEIAHLLLGTNSHSLNGIMRAHWHGEELQRIRQGTLLFTRAQEQMMRARLAPAERHSLGD